MSNELTPTSLTPSSSPATTGCCGGPAPVGTSACCVRDADAKAAGATGCGCGAASATTSATAAPAKSGCCV